jgi:ATP-binding cassette, subfamily B, bacterial MsbA
MNRGGPEAAGHDLRLTARTRSREVEPLRRLARYLVPLWPKLGLGLICLIVVSLLSVYNGTLAKHLIDSMQQAQDHRALLDQVRSLDPGLARRLLAVIQQHQLANSGRQALLEQLRRLDHYGLMVVWVFLAKGVFAFGQVYLISNVAQRLAMRIRNQVFEHLQSMSLSFFEARKTGQLMAAITADVPVIQNCFTTGIMDSIGAPLVILGGMAILFTSNWRLALVSFLVMPAMAAFIVGAGRRMRRHTASMQMTLSDISDLAAETLAAIRVVKSFAMERHESDRFARRSWEAFRSIMRGTRVRAVLAPIVELLGALGVTLVLWYGGRQVAQGEMTVGDLGKFIVILNLVGANARNLGNINLNLQQARAAAERIFGLLDVQPEIQDRPDAIELTRVEGEVLFEDVSFAYAGGSHVLHDLSFTLYPGQMGALVGESGAGKSTIANLIPRFYDVGAGAVLIDGHDVRDVRVQSLRRLIGIVPQETILFAGTVRENIAYGRPDAADTDIEAAARAANAAEFIERLPDGYQTVVGERGVKLSGGQRQRIAIARAILKDPRILILDEATSALDSHSERLFQEALDKLMVNRTTLVIAHRLSTVRNADVILFLKDGRVVEQGGHDELIALGGHYARSYSQFFADRAGTLGHEPAAAAPSVRGPES